MNGAYLLATLENGVANLADKAGEAARGPGFLGAAGSGESSFTWGGYFQAIGLLLVIIAVFWAALLLLRRKGGLPMLGIMNKDLAIESRLALGPRKYLAVVRYNDERLLLGITDHAICLITREGLDNHGIPAHGADHPHGGPHTNRSVSAATTSSGAKAAGKPKSGASSFAAALSRADNEPHS